MQVLGSAGAGGLSLRPAWATSSNTKWKTHFFLKNEMVFISDKILSRKASWPDREMTDKAKSTSFISCDKKRILRKKRRVSMGRERRSDSLHPGLQGQKQLALVGGDQGYGARGPCLGQCAHIVSRDSHNCISGKMRVWLHLSLADMFYLNL